ncbi:MAG: hypothetical protein HY883_03795 [Deltaproteobacteria bacterium]|nr:hypothetical protein [Deltaproteobacteria bacterium]
MRFKPGIVITVLAVLSVWSLFLIPRDESGRGTSLAQERKVFYLRPGYLKYDQYGQIDPTPDVTPLNYLPKDKFGFVDWAKALRDGVITPKDSLAGEEEYTVLFEEDVLIKAKLDFMPDVIFPHSAHNRWLRCGICHPGIFAMEAGASDISMLKIWKGEFCGRCHDKIAFPIRNCFRCHSVPKKY